MFRGVISRQLTQSRPEYLDSFIFIAVVFSLIGCLPAFVRTSQGTKIEWIRPVEAGSLVWGIKGGVVFAVWPSGFGTEGVGGPRGLFRIGYENDGEMTLVNFVAVEPIAAGKRGLSELEPSSIAERDMPLRLKRGKYFWPFSAYPPANIERRADTIEQMRRLTVPGWISNPSPGVEQLNVTLDVERFNNGAHPWIVASIRSDRPREVIFTIHAAPDSAPMQNCVLTSTMGNYIRARYLWLSDRVVYSKSLWPDPVTAGVGSVGFTRPMFFEESSMCLLKDGSLITMITTDEDEPSKVVPKPAFWQYRGRKVTQYWRVCPQQEHPLRIRVNGRFTYWMSQSPIPNGVAYENFELIQDYFDGQQFIFGVTDLSPSGFELAMRPPEPP